MQPITTRFIYSNGTFVYIITHSLTSALCGSYQRPHLFIFFKLITDFLIYLVFRQLFLQHNNRCCFNAEVTELDNGNKLNSYFIMWYLLIYQIVYPEAALTSFPLSIQSWLLSFFSTTELVIITRSFLKMWTTTLTSTFFNTSKFLIKSGKTGP